MDQQIQASEAYPGLCPACGDAIDRAMVLVQAEDDDNTTPQTAYNAVRSMQGFCGGEFCWLGADGIQAFEQQIANRLQRAEPGAIIRVVLPATLQHGAYPSRSAKAICAPQRYIDGAWLANRGTTLVIRVGA